MKEIGIAMRGVTGRMGKRQHLIRSIMEIIKQGGVQLKSGEVLMPVPYLIGRSEEKMRLLCEETGIKNWTTDEESLLVSDKIDIVFDAATTDQRAKFLQKAVEAGKHVYCEKPVSDNISEAKTLLETIQQKKVKSGIVQDKLFLPGLIKLNELLQNGKLGKILTLKVDFGYWVFNGIDTPAQRPSWNYRKKDGGGIVIDMMCHWQYVFEQLFAPVESVFCMPVTQIPERVDEFGKSYVADADDAFFAILRLTNGMAVHVSSSWNTRVKRDDLVIFQVDGTGGSASAGLTQCHYQTCEQTPLLSWDPDKELVHDFNADWTPYKPNEKYENGFKIQWEKFLRFIYDDEPFPWSIESGIRGLELVHASLQSWEEKKMIQIKS